MKNYLVNSDIVNSDIVNSDIVYEIDAQDCLVSYNEAWEHFARANQSAHLALPTLLHRSLWDFIVDRETRLIYEMLFDRLRVMSESVEFSFRCDTPTQRRYMQMELHPQKHQHIRLVSCIVREEAREYTPLLDPVTVRSTEFLTICSWCKRVELSQGVWAEVEEAMVALQLFDSPVMPQLTHGICPDCLQKFRDRRGTSQTAVLR